MTIKWLIAVKYFNRLTALIMINFQHTGIFILFWYMTFILLQCFTWHFITCIIVVIGIFVNNKCFGILKNVSGYICNHGSPSGERDTASPSWELRNASPRGRYGERYTHAAMLRGVQANVTQKASTKPTLPGWGSCPWDGWFCQWHYPLWPKAELHTLSTYPLGAGITGPRVQLTGLESEKDSFKGIWPST